MTTELEAKRLDQFEDVLLSNSSIRVDSAELWRALAAAFPHRTSGPEERRLMLSALSAIEARGKIRVPAARGKRWDRSMDPPVPTSVDLVRDPASRPASSWRTFPWHPSLQWVGSCRTLSPKQVKFLMNVHEGLVNGAFNEPAPLKYRSLQLTGDEKLLESFVATSIFGQSRLTLEMLACLPDALPLAWEPVGNGGRLLIFENSGPFAVARRVLGELESGPYDLVAYGGGKSVLAALGHIKTIDRCVDSIHYVGDLDQAGLDIARAVQEYSTKLGLPTVAPATELHRQMLLSADAFGYPQGWPGREYVPTAELQRVLDVLSADLRGRVRAIIEAGRRIPEEVLGPDELRCAWARLA